MDNTIIIDESAKQKLIENLYKGKGYINTLDPVPVETYAEMQVSGADTIVPENIKENEIILGVEGTYKGEGGNLLIVDFGVMDSSVIITYEDSDITIKELTKEDNQFNFEPRQEYWLRILPADGGYAAILNGKVFGYDYENFDLQISDYADTEPQYILNPRGSKKTWKFDEGDGCVIKLSSHP